MPKNNNLRRVYRKLRAIYGPLHIKCKERLRADMNKVHRTPSLNYQRAGLLKQDTIEWDPARVDKTACPSCGCENRTMATSPDADATVNAAKAHDRVLSMTKDGDGKIKGVSPGKSRFCYKKVCLGDNSSKICAVCQAAVE